MMVDTWGFGEGGMVVVTPRRYLQLQSGVTNTISRVRNTTMRDNVSTSGSRSARQEGKVSPVETQGREVWWLPQCYPPCSQGDNGHEASS